MTRKSKSQRISEGKALIAQIKQDPVLAYEQKWLIGFLSDLVSKFECGKGGTSRQRSLFDEKIAEGVPVRKAPARQAHPVVLRAEAMLPVLQKQPDLYSWEIRVAAEIITQAKVHNISDRQEELLTQIINRAELLQAQLETESVSEEMLAEAQLIINLADCYTNLPARKMKDINVLRSALQAGIPFTESQFNAGQEAVKGQKKKYDKWAKKAVEGALVKAGIRNGVMLETHPAIVVGPIEFKRRKTYSQWQGHRDQLYMYVPVLVGDQVFECSPQDIGKYTKKELKEMAVK